jgi:hypothetical protein
MIARRPQKAGGSISGRGKQVQIRTKLVLVGLSALLALFAFVGSGLADPSDMFFPVPPHRHFVNTANGKLVPIGPQVCEHPELQNAFEQFHYNVHHSHVPIFAGGPGDVETLGPQNGAPGLHNGAGSEITVTLC